MNVINHIADSSERYARCIQVPEHELTEDQLLEQFAAIEEGITLLQSQMRDLSDNVKIFSSLARHMRRASCPTTPSPRQAV